MHDGQFIGEVDVPVAVHIGCVGWHAGPGDAQRVVGFVAVHRPAPGKAAQVGDILGDAVVIKDLIAPAVACKPEDRTCGYLPMDAIRGGHKAGLVGNHAENWIHSR